MQVCCRFLAQIILLFLNLSKTWRVSKTWQNYPTKINIFIQCSPYHCEFVFNKIIFITKYTFFRYFKRVFVLIRIFTCEWWFYNLINHVKYAQVTIRGIWEHSFSTFAKFSEKLTFLKIKVRNISFSENFANVLNEWSHTKYVYGLVRSTILPKILSLKSFGNSWGNFCSKFVVLDIKYRFTCGYSDLC